MPQAHVRHVNGRYPFRPGVFRSENIEATVRQIDDTRFCIELDDSSPRHSDMWMRIEVELVEEVSRD